MAGTLSINVQEARGAVAVPANVDNLAVVIGVSSLGDGASPFYLSGQVAAAALGKGDAVDILTQIIEQRQEGSAVPKVPAAMYSTPTDTDGSYGTIDDTGVTGTVTVTVDALSIPLGTYEARLRCVTGGAVGTAGMKFRWSLDGGRTWSSAFALGTAETYTIPGSGVKFDFSATTDTFVAGDEVTVRTFGPTPGTTEIADAFTALAASSLDFSLVVIDCDATAAVVAAVTTGLNALAAVGKDCSAILRARIPDFENDETEAAWLAAVADIYDTLDDDRILIRASYQIITDAVTSRRYLRSDLAQFAADVVRVPRAAWPCAPADRPMPNASLVDDNGADVGHDEGPRGAATGLSDESQGNRLSCVQRLPDQARREDVFNTVPWVLYPSDSRVRNLMTRRLANAMKRVARSAATPTLGAKLFFTAPEGASTGTLTEASRKAAQAIIFQAVSSEFGDEIGNATDAALDSGLVQVKPTVAISGGNLISLDIVLAPNVGGYVLSIGLTLAIQQG